ncbi:hypothetical protein ACLIA0_00925 [Bacillaceae bacterium W0354]
MRTILQSFALGLLIATLILTIVYFSEEDNSNGNQNYSMNEEDARSLLEQNGYTLVLSSDYDQIVNENKSLKDEIISLEKRFNELETTIEVTEENDNNREEDTERDEIEEQETNNDEGNREIILTISRGMTSIDISNVLFENNIIDDADRFNQFLEQNGYSRKIQLGEYEVSDKMSDEQIANIITK